MKEDSPPSRAHRHNMDPAKVNSQKEAVKSSTWTSRFASSCDGPG